MSERETQKPQYDPFAPWIRYTESWMKAWSSVMSETVASETFASTMGEQMGTMLEATKLVRQQMKASMEQYLQQMNLPTRDQITSLTQRLTNIEMRLDDLDAKADESLDRLRSIQTTLEADS